MIPIQNIHTIADWQALRQTLSAGEELLVFKKSPKCSVSFFIESDVQTWAGKVSAPNLKIVRVDVVQDRQLSQYIAQESGIKHESPQVLWLHADGTVKWHGSHYRITAAALDAQCC